MHKYYFLNVIKFYKNCRYFATAEPLSHTTTAWSRSFSPAPAPAKSPAPFHWFQGFGAICLWATSDFGSGGHPVFLIWTSNTYWRNTLIPRYFIKNYATKMGREFPTFIIFTAVSLEDAIMKKNLHCDIFLMVLLLLL